MIRSCADYNPSNGAAAICGLQPAIATAVIDYVSPVGIESSMTLALGNTLGDQRFTLFNNSTTIYRMDKSIGDALMALLTQE